MSGLETAIRNALERSDRSSAETRARIYQSARNALESGLRKQDVHDTDVISQQRHRLETIIHTIEIEERATLKEGLADVEPVSVDANAVGNAVREQDIPPARRAASLAESLEGAIDGPRNQRQEPSLASADGGLSGLRPDRLVGDLSPDDDADTVVADPVAAGPVTAGRTGRLRSFRARTPRAIATPPPRKSRRGRLLSLFMVVAILVAAFGTAAWWAETSGLLKSAEQRDTGVSNPPATVRSDDFNGDQGLKTLGPNSAFSGDWIDVFNPGDQALASAGAHATISPLTDETGTRLHMTSASADAAGNIRIDIPVDVLQQLSGKTSTVALSVQADSATQTQFSVECDFSSLGECGRHRFTVNDEKSDMLFKVTFDRSLAPSTPGHMLINSDVTGQGKSLDLFAVRVLPGQ